MKKQKGFTLFVLIGVFVTALMVYGYVHNIILLIGSELEPLTTMVIVRMVGIFVPPVGAVMGYV